MSNPSYPRSYAEIASAYAANPAYAEADLSLNDFSELGNYFTNSANYDQGTGNWFTNTAKDFAYNKNKWIDENLAPAVNFTGDIGEGLFKFFGADQAAGRQVGEGLISQTVDFLPQLAGYGIGALFPPAASVSVPLGNAITGAMSGATALEASDSYGQAAIMASLPYVAPGISNVGARAGVNTLAKPLAGTTIGKALGFEGGRTIGDQILGKTMADRISGFVGSEVAIFSATEAASVAVAALEGEAYNPFTKENLLGNLLQTVAMPFSYAELIHPIKMGPAGAAAFDLQKENSLTLADAEALLSKLEATEVKTKLDPRVAAETDYLAALKQVDTILDPKLRAQAKASVEKIYQEYRAEPTKTGSDLEQQVSDVTTLFKKKLDETMAKSKGVVEEAAGTGVTIDPVNTPFNLENFMDGKPRYILAGASKIGLSGWEHVSLGGGLESREVFRAKEGNYIREIVRTGENGQTPALLKRSYTDSTETEFSLDYETGRYNVEGPREVEFQLPDGTIDQARVQEEFKRQAFPSLSRQLDKLKTMGEPTKLADMQDQIITVNEVRAEYNMEPVHDGTLNDLVDRNIQDGTSLAQGTQMAVNQVKEETKRAASFVENNRGGRKPKPYSDAEVSEKLNEIVEISGDIADKEQLKIAQQGLKLIKLPSEMDRYMRNATAVVYRFLANAKKTAELGRNPEALASLNGLTPRQIRRLGYIISKGEVALKPEQRMAAWEATKNSVAQTAKRKDTKYVTLATDTGVKAFKTLEEAEAFALANIELGARVAQAGGKKKVDGTKGPTTWYVRTPQRETNVDVDSYASAEAVEIVESVVAVDLAPIDPVDAESAGEAVIDSLESLLARAAIAWPEGSSIDVKQLRELSKAHPDAVRNRLLQELAPLEPSEVEDMFSGYQTEDPEYFADFGELLNKETERTKDFPKEWSYGESERFSNFGDEPEFFTDDFILHQLHNIDDLSSVLKTGLRPGTNLSKGSQADQSLGGGAMLVYKAADLTAKPKLYQNDLLVHKQSEKAPIAIMFDRDSVAQKTRIPQAEADKRIVELQQKQEALQTEMLQLKDSQPKAEDVKKFDDTHYGYAGEMYRFDARDNGPGYGFLVNLRDSSKRLSVMRHGGELETAIKDRIARQHVDVELERKIKHADSRYLHLMREEENMWAQSEDTSPIVSSDDVEAAHAQKLQEASGLPIYSYEVNEDGKPVNVLKYNAKNEQANFDGGAGESRKAVEVTSFPELLQRVMIKKGFTAEQVKEAMPYMAAVANVTNMSDVKFGQMLDDAKRGTATIDGPLRMLLLSAKGLNGLSFVETVRTLGFLSGHEIGHLVEHLYRKSMLSEQDMKSFKDFVKWTTEATPEEQRMAFEVIRDGMLPKEYHELEIVQRAFETIGKPEELRAHLMSMWAMSHVHKGDQMANMLLPTPVRRFMQMLTDFAWRSYGAVRGALHRMPNVGTYDARHRAWKLKKLMESARDAEFKAESIIKEFEGIGMVGPEVRQVWDKRVEDLQGQSKELDGFLRMFEEGDKKETVVDTKVKTQASVVPLKTSKIAALFDRLFFQGDQLAAAVPALKNPFHALHSFNGNTKAMSKRSVGQLTGGVDASGNPFWTSAGQLAWERVTGPKHRVNNKMLGDWMRLQQETMGQALNEKGDLVDIPGKMLALADLAQHDSKLAARLAAASPKDREAIVEMKDRLTASMQQLQTDVAKHFEEAGVLNLQAYLALKMPKAYKDVPGLALGMFKVLKLNLQGDAQGSQGLLSKIAQSIPDEGAFIGAWDLAKKNFENWVELQKFFATRQWFFSEIRQGEFLLKWNEANGKHGSLAFDTLKQVRAFEQKLHARGATVKPMIQAKRGQPHFNVEPEWLMKVDELETANKMAIDNMSNLTPEEKESLKATHSYKADFMRAFAAHEVFQPGSQRQLAAGREDLDMVNTHIAYINASSRAINRQVLNHALNYGYANPDLKDPTIAHYVEQSKRMVNNFMVADTELGTAITTTNAAYFLGLNFSSHMIELMQPLFTFVPELRNQGIGYFKANKMIAAAQQDTAKFFAQHLPNKVKRRFDPSLNEKDDNRLWKSAEEGDLMNWAATRGLISLTHISDIYEADVNSTTDLTSLSHGGSKSLAQKAYSPVKMFAGFSLKIYQQFTEFNARVSLLTGYRLGKEKGLGHAEAREFAADFSRRVTFSGGKANRPELLFGGEGDFRTAGQAAYSLNGYTFGVLSMARRYAMTGYSKRQFPNMTEADRKQARAALRTLVTTQFAGAGLLGMPFVGAAMALVEEYSDEEPVLDIKLALAEFFGEDAEQGGLLGDIVMQGAANAFSNKLLPGAPDFQSRFAIGTVMGLNPYSGFSLDQLAGPTGSIVRNIGAGLKALTQEGSFERAVGEWAPVGMKKYLELARNDGALTDARGNMIIDANPEEQLMYAIGFTPQRVKKARELKNLQLRHEEVNRRQDTRFHDDAADLYFRDPQAAAAKIRQRATEDKFYSEQAGMTKIVERVEKKLFANDPARSGTQAGTQGMEPLLRAMNMSSSATEQQRLMLKNDVMRQLGGRPNMSPTSMTRARMIDQAMVANPYLPRAQAAAQVDEQLSRRL